jgi:hypothetical protein
MTFFQVFRAARPPQGRIALPVLLALALIAGNAWAQHRAVPLPANAVYGDLKAFAYPQAQIGKKWLRLAPGARIYDTRNLIITPGMVPSPASVLFRLDINGQVSQMWLLTAAEAKAAKQRAKNAKP